MVGILRLYQDSYGANMGARTFCLLSEYFGGVIITDNKKIRGLPFNQITYAEALANKAKFTKLIVYNTKPNMFGGVAAKHTASAVRLILSIKDVYYFNCDPILDLPKGVADSHEKQCPGLREAIFKLNQGTHLSRKNTDLTKFLAAQIARKPHKLDKVVRKDFVGCYFGDPRGNERQKQVKALLKPLKSALIIGHEHEDFAWFYYTPDFYDLIDMAYVTPIIGDQKLHYETGIPSIRLYEVWHTSTVALVDRRFNVDGLDDSFYFSTPEEFHAKAKLISENPELWEKMISTQLRLLRNIKHTYAIKTFDWASLKRKRLKEEKQRHKLVKEIKQKPVEAAKQRLIDKGILKPKRNVSRAV